MHPLTNPNILVPLATLAITLGYIGTCALWPFKPCRYCHGTGKLRSPVIGAIRLCPRCPQASGLRLRAGRKAFNTYRRLHRANRRNNTTNQ